MSADVLTGDPLNTLLDRIVGLRPNTGRYARQFALQLYRLLARGNPVRVEELAETLNRRSFQMRRTIDSWPSLVQQDEHKRVVGFGGLTLERTQHRFSIGGRSLYTWCAWDSLFIPEIIGKTAHVQSECPVTSRSISVTVRPDGVSDCDPPEAIVSFLLPDAVDLEQDVRGSFCEYVHFFASRDAGDEWTRRNEGTFLLTVSEAFELGRRKNASQFGDILKQSSPLKR
ncbi:MAG: alkylmercury lyase MerB [Gemmatimonadetes bacterium]|nr:alkylmercury lyase MerB [Gemmatimonadota bacterium]